ncbi:MAG: hypothetical protein F6K56_13765 [Moorea sp. SIO3G5]|nr:hypothetical protein [Moorena sp. SIO3G5]
MERASGWNGHLGGTGIWVERASGWNGHLGGTGIWVERASCPFHSQAGRMPTLLGWGGQDAHSTGIQREDSATP